jgi:L-ascorbate metabolism protein UlaG (beta-lactamase superfamily)
LRSWLLDAGARKVDEIDWWDAVLIDGVRVVLTPAQHWSKRTPWDRNESLWGGFVLESRTSPTWRFLYTGDTGYSADFSTIRQRLGPIDLAAIPIGAYEPRDFMKNQHTNPDDAVQILLDLNAKQAIGVHWGTFELTQEAFDQPPIDLAKSLASRQIDPQRFVVLKHGQTLKDLR